MDGYTCEKCGDYPTRLSCIDFDNDVIKRQCQNKNCLHIQEEKTS